ncbi:MAG: hypothetical protein ABH827_02735 [bacterium]
MTFDLLRIIKTTKFQLMSILAVVCYIMLLFVLQYKQTIHSEEFPKLLQVDDKIKKLATPVTVGIHVNSFPDFSFSSNNFSIDATVWFRFAQATESLDTLGKFTLKNSKLLGDGSLIYKSPPIIKILDKEVLVSYHIQANFMAVLKYNFFPIGDHKLSFILQNKSVTAQELVFVTEPGSITLPENMLVENWKPKETVACAGYIKADFNPQDSRMNITYPCVAFTVGFENVSARLPVSLYFPLFILFFLMLISMMLNITDSNRIGLVSAGVPALVLFRLVIDSVSPRVGYITHIDKVYYLVVFLSLLILFLQTYIVLVLHKSGNLDEQTKKLRNEKLENLNDILFVLILVLLVVFLTIYWI